MDETPSDIDNSPSAESAARAGPGDHAMSDADLRSAAVRGLRWIVLSRPIIELVLFGSMIALARLITPAEFGRYAVALIVTQLLVVPSAGVGAALVQRPNGGSREYLETGFAMCLLMAAVTGSFTVFAAGFIVAPVWGHRTAELVLFLALAIPMGAPATMSAAILQRRLAFRKLNMVQLLSTILSSSLQVAFAVAGLQAMALVLGGLAGGLLGVILMWALAPLPLPRLRRSVARDITSYGWATALAAVSWAGFNNCDYAIVGWRLGAVQAGFYFRAYTLGVEYQRKLSQVLPNLGFPLLARADSADNRDALTRRMVRLVSLIIFPGLVLLGILAPVLVPIVYGPQWMGAVGPTQIIVAAGAATIVIDAGAAALMASGRSRPLMAFGWAHFATYAVAVVIVSPLGIEAVAVAAVVVHTTFMLISYSVVLGRTGGGRTTKVIDGIGYLLQDLAPATVASGALLAAAVGTELIASAAGAPKAVTVMLIVASGLIGYLGVLRTLSRSSFTSLKNIALHLLPKRSLRLAARRVASVSPSGS